MTRTSFCQILTSETNPISINTGWFCKKPRSLSVVSTVFYVEFQRICTWQLLYGIWLRKNQVKIVVTINKKADINFRFAMACKLLLESQMQYTGIHHPSLHILTFHLTTYRAHCFLYWCWTVVFEVNHKKNHEKNKKYFFKWSNENNKSINSSITT